MSNVGKVFNLSGGGGSGSPKMESLTIATTPNKTVYKSGETFDPTGMVVVANYGEGLMANVTGYTVSPSVLTDGVSEVVITYTEGRITKTATVAVTVKKVLVSIAITTQITRLSFEARHFENSLFSRKHMGILAMKLMAIAMNMGLMASKKPPTELFTAVRFSIISYNMTPKATIKTYLLEDFQSPSISCLSFNGTLRS